MPYGSRIVRPRKLVAVAVLTAAVALVALPGLAGSRSPRPDQPLDAAAFQTVSVNAITGGSAPDVDPLDSAYRSDGFLTADSTFIEPGDDQTAPQGRPAITSPSVKAASVMKPPRYTLSGYATFYDNGTTAMRLPRGTVVVICGGGGCVQRIVNDYGPMRTDRVVDLYRADFFDICGCPSFAGTTWVTVKVY
jgi:hypothetical protein